MAALAYTPLAGPYGRKPGNRRAVLIGTDTQPTLRLVAVPPRGGGADTSGTSRRIPTGSWPSAFRPDPVEPEVVYAPITPLRRDDVRIRAMSAFGETMSEGRPGAYAKELCAERAHVRQQIASPSGSRGRSRRGSWHRAHLRPLARYLRDGDVCARPTSGAARLGDDRTWLSASGVQPGDTLWSIRRLDAWTPGRSEADSGWPRA